MQRQGYVGNKTEKPTPKKLRDAHAQGKVAKSKELTSTLVLAFTFSVLWFSFSSHLEKLLGLLTSILAIPKGPFAQNLFLYGSQAIDIFISICAIVLIPIALFGLFVEFVQTGPLFILRKFVPRLSNLNGMSGSNRMFSLNSAFAFTLSLFKALILIFVSYIVVRSFMHELVQLTNAPAPNVAMVFVEVFKVLLLWTIGIFTLFMLFDWSYQRYAFMKEMRMSIQEVRDEQKDSEADPKLKSKQRRWFQRSDKNLHNNEQESTA